MKFRRKSSKNPNIPKINVGKHNFAEKMYF